MPEGFIGSSKRVLNNFISNESIGESEYPYLSFSEKLLNFHSHYCYNDHSSPFCLHEKEKDDGPPYTSKYHFTCQAQADGFRELLQAMASRPQDYVSARGRRTTNAVEGFHGLALM